MQVIWRKNARPKVSVIKSQNRVSRDPGRGRQVKIGFLNANKLHRMKQDKVKFIASGLKTFSILLKNPEQVWGGRGSRTYREQPETSGGVETAEEEEGAGHIESSQKHQVV